MCKCSTHESTKWVEIQVKRNQQRKSANNLFWWFVAATWNVKYVMLYRWNVFMIVTLRDWEW